MLAYIDAIESIANTVRFNGDCLSVELSYLASRLSYSV
jgi:hypothetical protein